MKIVSIITVNFNQPAVTEDLLRSLREVNTYSNIEIIVVDNGSTINPVPEPGTYALALMGLAVVGGAVRRRRQA